MVGVFVSIFFFTAVLGRVWCGWGCPQTVYLEFVFRPLERFFEGTPGRAKKGWLQTSPAGTVLKYVTYLLLAGHLANTFLAYFVGVDNLVIWTLRSPLDHPAPFLVFAVVTVLMLVDFGFFREQTCLILCPYGRFQSVLLDRNSLIVSYDRGRGEPRGKLRSPGAVGVDLTVGATEAPGDCIDCRMCVTTCPTGIDIRNGLQMECVHCTQCIDACDAIMDKIHKPRGLIRYASQATISGERPRVLRPRLFVYGAVLTVIATAFIALLVTRSPLDATILRARGEPFSVSETGVVTNNVKIKLVNRGEQTASYSISIIGATGSAVKTDSNPVELSAGEMRTILARLEAPGSEFVGGHLSTRLRIVGPDGFSKELPFRLIGPEADNRHEADERKEDHR
jgi:cytochrome c oxidase accessory protein FixG